MNCLHWFPLHRCKKNLQFVPLLCLFSSLPYTSQIKCGKLKLSHFFISTTPSTCPPTKLQLRKSPLSFPSLKCSRRRRNKNPQHRINQNLKQMELASTLNLKNPKKYKWSLLSHQSPKWKVFEIVKSTYQLEPVKISGDIFDSIKHLVNQLQEKKSFTEAECVVLRKLARNSDAGLKSVYTSSLLETNKEFQERNFVREAKELAAEPHN